MTNLMQRERNENAAVFDLRCLGSHYKFGMDGAIQIAAARDIKATQKVRSVRERDRGGAGNTPTSGLAALKQIQSFHESLALVSIRCCQTQQIIDSHCASHKVSTTS